MAGLEECEDVCFSFGRSGRQHVCAMKRGNSERLSDSCSLLVDASFFSQPLVGALAAQSTMGSVVIVVAFPLLHFAIEAVHVMSYNTLQFSRNCWKR